MRTTRMGIEIITVDELGDQDAMLLQISGAKIKSFSNDYLRGGDEKVVLTFVEFKDAEYILNATSFRALADRYGNDQANLFRSWINKPCVLVRSSTDNPQTGEKIEALWVAKPAEWREAVQALAALEGPPKAAKGVRGVKRAAKRAKD